MSYRYPYQQQQQQQQQRIKKWYDTIPVKSVLIVSLLLFLVVTANNQCLVVQVQAFTIQSDYYHNLPTTTTTTSIRQYNDVVTLVTKTRKIRPLLLSSSLSLSLSLLSINSNQQRKTRYRHSSFKNNKEEKLYRTRYNYISNKKVCTSLYLVQRRQRQNDDNNNNNNDIYDEKQQQQQSKDGSTGRSDMILIGIIDKTISILLQTVQLPVVGNTSIATITVLFGQFLFFGTISFVQSVVCIILYSMFILFSKVAIIDEFESPTKEDNNLFSIQKNTQRNEKEITNIFSIQQQIEFFSLFASYVTSALLVPSPIESYTTSTSSRIIVESMDVTSTATFTSSSMSITTVSSSSSLLGSLSFVVFPLFFILLLIGITATQQQKTITPTIQSTKVLEEERDLPLSPDEKLLYQWDIKYQQEQEQQNLQESQKQKQNERKEQ